MIIRTRIKLDLRNMRRVKAALATNTGPAQDVLEAIENTYRAYVVNRFDVYSRGGGNWPRLKPATIRRKGRSIILVDSRFMRRKLAQAIVVKRRRGRVIEVGFKSNAVHPRANMPVDRLLSIHDQGLGVPKRQILVKPDKECEKRMRRVVKQMLTDELNGESTSARARLEKTRRGQREESNIPSV